MKDAQASDSAKLGSRSSSGMSLVWPPRALVIRVRISGVPLFFVVRPKDMKVSQEVFQSEWQSQMAHQSIKLYEFDHYIFTYSTEFAGKIIVEPEGENEKNMITIHMRTSSGKTISIKCDKKRKAMSILDEVERRSAIRAKYDISRASWKSVDRKKNNRRKTTLEQKPR